MPGHYKRTANESASTIVSIIITSVNQSQSTQIYSTDCYGDKHVASYFFHTSVRTKLERWYKHAKTNDLMEIKKGILHK